MIWILNRIDSIKQQKFHTIHLKEQKMSYPLNHITVKILPNCHSECSEMHSPHNLMLHAGRLT